MQTAAGANSQRSAEVAPGYKKAPLFGSAMSITLPSSYRDVSNVRYVNDWQEVWQDSAEDGGVMVIVEILQYAGLKEGVGRYYFTDLAASSGASEGDYTVGDEDVVAPDDDFMSSLRRRNPLLEIIRVSGTQRLNLSLKDDVPRRGAVNVCMVVVRIEKFMTDILITYTIEDTEGTGGAVNVNGGSDSDNNGAGDGAGGGADGALEAAGDKLPSGASKKNSSNDDNNDNNDTAAAGQSADEANKVNDAAAAAEVKPWPALFSVVCDGFDISDWTIFA